jgi:hypothetical protein
MPPHLEGRGARGGRAPAELRVVRDAAAVQNCNETG